MKKTKICLKTNDQINNPRLPILSPPRYLFFRFALKVFKLVLVFANTGSLSHTVKGKWFFLLQMNKHTSNGTVHYIPSFPLVFPFSKREKGERWVIFLWRDSNWLLGALLESHVVWALGPIVVMRLPLSFWSNKKKSSDQMSLSHHI